VGGRTDVLVQFLLFVNFMHFYNVWVYLIIVLAMPEYYHFCVMSCLRRYFPVHFSPCLTLIFLVFLRDSFAMIRFFVRK
jgi:hypothetical protein